MFFQNSQSCKYFRWAPDVSDQKEAEIALLLYEFEEKLKKIRSLNKKIDAEVWKKKVAIGVALVLMVLWVTTLWFMIANK